MARGIASGRTPITRSPLIPNGSLLVVKTRSSADAARSADSSRRHPGRTCSQLSSINSIERSATCRQSCSSASMVARALSPSWVTTASATVSELRCAPSSTNQVPSRNARSSAADNAADNVVLPTPPGPVSVTRRVAENNSRALASSRWRRTIRPVVAPVLEPEILGCSSRPLCSSAKPVVMDFSGRANQRAAAMSVPGHRQRGEPAEHPAEPCLVTT